MPRKGHTCCVLGCTVNSKKTELADGRRPRFFCFPHERKRPHLRRAWLALTRRTEASTNTRVCEFHFVEGKPSNVNPHPILNMGMEPTKMQKRAMELRQQKELRKMLMQQQLAAGGPISAQVLPGGAIVTADGQIIGQNGLGMGAAFGQQQMGDVSQDQFQDGLFQMPQLDNMYEDSIAMGAAMGENADGLPSQIDYQYPMSLVVHDRNSLDELDNSMGSLAQELLNTTPDNEEGDDDDEEDDSKDHSDPVSDLTENTKPTSEDLDALPEDFSKIIPSNDSDTPLLETTKQTGEDLDALPEDFCQILPTNGSEIPTSTDNDMAGSSFPTHILPAKSENDVKPDIIANHATDITVIEQTTDIQIESNGVEAFVQNPLQGVGHISYQQNGHVPGVGNKSTGHIFNNQILSKSILSVIKNQIPKPSASNETSKLAQIRTPLKVPSWQMQQNGALSSMVIPSEGAPVAKKTRKRKSTPHMIPNVSKSLIIPGMMKAVPIQPPKSVNQSKIIMTMNNVEKMKSDILENLRAEFLTEFQQESESNKQLKIEMETVRMQTRQEIQQMRVELHALWGENQRLRAQVEGLLQEKESGAIYNNIDH